MFLVGPVDPGERVELLLGIANTQGRHSCQGKRKVDRYVLSCSGLNVIGV